VYLLSRILHDWKDDDSGDLEAFGSGDEKGGQDGVGGEGLAECEEVRERYGVAPGAADSGVRFFDVYYVWGGW